jgi:ribosomal-protein-alanine N-acetyltransferase
VIELPGFVLASAGPADVFEIAGLAASALREAWSEAGYAGILQLPQTVCVVARGSQESALAGFVLAQRVIDELHVLSLAVAADSRRRGVARALLGRALGAPPAARVLLEVRPSNAAALSFYRALGFAAVGLRRGYYPDGEDALLLTRGEASSLAAGRAAGRGA